MASHQPLEPPKEMRRGPHWLRGAFNRLRAFCLQGQIYSVVQSGVTTPQLIRTPQGQLLKLPKGGSGGMTTRIFPFQLLDASTDDPLAQVRVRYGTVNSIAPDGMSPGDDPNFLIEVADGDSVYLHVVWDTSDFEIVTLEILAGSPVPSDVTTVDGEYYLEIGSVAVDTMPATPVVTIAQSLQDSQTFSACRNWFTSPASWSATWAVA